MLEGRGGEMDALKLNNRTFRQLLLADRNPKNGIKLDYVPPVEVDAWMVFPQCCGLILLGRC